MEKTMKPPACFWVRLLFGMIKNRIQEKLDQKTITDEEKRDLKELTSKIVDLSKEDGNKAANKCGLRYSYIMGATNILKLSQTDFPERKDLFCEVLTC